MSDPFIERMKRLLASTPPETPAPRPAGAGTSGLERTGTPPSSDLQLPGDVLQSAYGPVRRIRAVHTTAWPYSPRPIEQVLPPHVTGNARWLKDSRLAGFVREEALFLDVEATGLFQDANNVAFLVGIAWFEPEGLVLEQLFLESPEEEPALLQHLLARLEGKRFLVSYNGKAYDKTVLESRFVLNRLMDQQSAHLRLLPHLDLLHVGRRIYGGLLPGHKLSTMEQQVLHFERGDDIPGALVPQYYYEYLLRGRVDRMLDVIRHNEVDVLTLVHLADSLLATLDVQRPTGTSAIDANIGWLLLNNGFKQEAVRFLQTALAGIPDDQLYQTATRLESALGGAKGPKEALVELWSSVARRLPAHPLTQGKLERVLRRKR